MKSNSSFSARVLVRMLAITEATFCLFEAAQMILALLADANAAGNAPSVNAGN